MADTVIKVENLWKEYRLGTISHHSMMLDFQSWWARVWGKEDPNSRIDSRLESKTSNVKPIFDPDRFWALKNVSFEVKRGEVLGIIGRNGAGKSTLLKILSKVTTPTKGQVTYKGRIASLLEVGTGFHPDLTGRENVFLNGAILGMSKEEIRRKFDEIVAFAEIEKFIDTPVKRYSSGMYVRLAFGVAAHLEPEILIVDEVLAVGDAAFQKKCLGKMSDVAKGGRTVIFVSHNMEAVARLCSTCQWLDGGGVIEYGSSLKVIHRYLEGCTSDIAVWERPEDEIDTRKTAQILRVALVNDQGKPLPVIRYDEQTKIEIDSLFHKNIDGVAFAMFINNAMGSPVFVSSDQDANACKPFDRMAGRFKTECSLPTSILMPGSYTVTVGLNREMIARLDRLEDIIRFEVSNVNNPCADGRPGAISPILKWKTISY